MSLPIVLLTGQNKQNENQTYHYGCHYSYLQAVTMAGGLPLIMSDISPNHSEALADMADVLLMTGGQDIEPERYGENNDAELSYDMDPVRDAFEFAVLDSFVKRKKPIFGICRGLQAINVYFGGSLIQDIPSQKGLEHPFDTWHKVKVTGDNLLSETLGCSFTTNSYHHQAINRLGEGLEVIATADPQSEIIEAIRHKSLPIMALQWHPERLCSETVKDFLGSWDNGSSQLSFPPDMLPLLKRFINFKK